jgi:hypothetical protein
MKEKFIVTEKAVREYIKEMMKNPDVGWQSSGEISDSPASVSACVDTSKAITNPMDQNFKPHNKAELHVALTTLVDDVADDDAAKFYQDIKDTLRKSDEDKEMNNKNIEETIRAAVRKMLSEAELPPVKKIPMGVHGDEYMRKFKKTRDDLRKELKRLPAMDIDDTAAGDPADREPSDVKKNVMASELGGASLKDISKELGFKSESGARQFIEKTLEKAKPRIEMDPDELDIFVLSTMKDYIDTMAKTGELTPADIKLMKDHPSIVEDLDSWRDYLNWAFKQVSKAKLKNPLGESKKKISETMGAMGAMSGGGAARRRAITARMIAADSKKDSNDQICDSCGKPLQKQNKPGFMNKVKQYFSDSTTCEDCAKKESADPTVSEAKLKNPLGSKWYEKPQYDQNIPKCDSCGIRMSKRDKSAYGSAGGEGWPSTCEECAEAMSADPTVSEAKLKNPLGKSKKKPMPGYDNPGSYEARLNGMLGARDQATAASTNNPMCDSCGIRMSKNDLLAYEEAGHGKGWPAICEECAEAESADPTVSK